MIRTLASGAFSATALAKSRTMEALVLNKSRHVSRGTSDNDRIIHTITSHAGLARHTSGNDNDVGALERICETWGSGIVTTDLPRSANIRSSSVMAAYLALSVDVANVSRDT
jgi:hypothetical protein